MDRNRFLGYVRLVRPPNLPTAAADVLAGAAITGGAAYPDWGAGRSADLSLLVLATVLLYAGGVVLNDVFDYKLDLIERPERPLPSGLVPVRGAAWFGGLLLATGVGAAFAVSPRPGGVASILALAILLYDAVSKKYDLVGPLNMGACRALNLVLGMSLFAFESTSLTYALVPLVYIFAITLVSRGEVHGSNRKNILAAGVLYGAVIALLLSLTIRGNAQLMITLPPAILFGAAIFIPLVYAYKHNTPSNIKKAVIAGVLSLVLLDVAVAVGFTDWRYGLCILALLPLSMGLSRLYAVT